MLNYSTYQNLSVKKNGVEIVSVSNVPNGSGSIPCTILLPNHSTKYNITLELTNGTQNKTKNYTPCCACENSSQRLSISNETEFEEESDFAIIPNPTDKYLKVLFSAVKLNENSLIQIFSNTGKLMETINARNNILEINTSQYKNGMYFIKYYDGLELHIKKFIVMH